MGNTYAHKVQLSEAILLTSHMSCYMSHEMQAYSLYLQTSPALNLALVIKPGAHWPQAGVHLVS